MATAKPIDVFDRDEEWADLARPVEYSPQFGNSYRDNVVATAVPA